HRDAALDLGPVEGLDQRLRQCQAGCLDEYVLGRALALQEALQGRQEIVGDGAADAAIRQLDHILLAAAFEAAAEQQLAIDAELAELVDDERQLPSIRLGDEMAEEAGLAGTEKAGDDGRGNFLLHFPSFQNPLPPCGGGLGWGVTIRSL